MECFPHSSLRANELKASKFEMKGALWKDLFEKVKKALKIILVNK